MAGIIILGIICIILMLVGAYLIGEASGYRTFDKIHEGYETANRDIDKRYDKITADFDRERVKILEGLTKDLMKEIKEMRAIQISTNPTEEEKIEFWEGK